MTLENIANRINHIEDRLEQDHKKDKKKKLDKTKKNSKSPRKSKARFEEEDKHNDQFVNYESEDQPENQGNSYIEQVIEQNQEPVQNYKDEVESIHQILSREIDNMPKKQHEEESKDDHNIKEHSASYIQNDWSSYSQAKVLN